MNKLLALTLAAGAALATVAPTSAAPAKLQGTVGPGFTIHLARNGKSVSRLPAGTYLLVVADRSPIHDFHITGNGVNKRVTSVAFVGTKTVRITLKHGTYTYVCDPHRSLMLGSFKVA